MQTWNVSGKCHVHAFTITPIRIDIHTCLLTHIHYIHVQTGHLYISQNIKERKQQQQQNKNHNARK